MCFIYMAEDWIFLSQLYTYVTSKFTYVQVKTTYMQIKNEDDIHKFKNQSYTPRSKSYVKDPT